MQFFGELADGLGNQVVLVGTGGGDEALGTDDTSDGGGGEAEGAKEISVFIETGVGIESFDQAAGKNADEGNLFDEAGDIGGFYAGEVTFFETAGIEAMLEVVAVARLGTAAAGGR